METTRMATKATLSVGTDAPVVDRARSAEWDAPALRPVAHWVVMPTEAGGGRLEMVWEIPNPMPPTTR